MILFALGCSLFDPAGGEVEPARSAAFLDVPCPDASMTAAGRNGSHPAGTATKRRTAPPLTR